MGLKSFRGGVHPPEQKDRTSHQPFHIMPQPGLVVLPLVQHLGRAATPLVKKGERVRAGAVVAQAEGFVSAPVHSPVAGVVRSVGREPHSSGFPKDAIVIAPDAGVPAAAASAAASAAAASATAASAAGTAAEASDTPVAEGPILLPPLDAATADADAIRARVREAGIVGQGGAAFPTHVKLQPPEGVTIEMLILNGCECEPYLTRDEQLMIERGDDVVTGMRLMMRALGVTRGVIGIEDNKPEAIAAMRRAVAGIEGLSVEALRTRYPQGAEKMLIVAITGREVPPGKLPLDVGVVIQNVGTAVAVADAVVRGEAQITAALTVTGSGVRAPKNVIAPVGTPLAAVLDFCGGVTEDAAMVIVGGPMMGVAQHDLTAPLMKATSGIVVLTRTEVERREETACLRCGTCVDACPLHLVPTRLARLSELGRDEDAESLGVTVCMECGTCAYACPANIPLVQWIRLGKKRVQEMQRARQTTA